MKDRSQSTESAGDDVLARTWVREVAGVFHTADTLEQAIGLLETEGFDRADIDIMGDAEAISERLGKLYVPVEERPDLPGMPRRAFIGRDDVETATVTVAGTLFAIGAMAATIGVVASGGGLAVALLAAAAAGSATGGLGALATNAIGHKEAQAHDLQLQAGGIVLWVRVRDDEQVRKAQAILRDSGADTVRTHVIQLEKHLADVPLARFNPDPWLGADREPN